MENIENKMQTYKTVTQCQKTILLTLITPEGVRENKYTGLIVDEVVLEDLFQKDFSLRKFRRKKES